MILSTNVIPIKIINFFNKKKLKEIIFTIFTNCSWIFCALN